MGFTEVALIYDRFNDLSAYDHWLAFTQECGGKEVKAVLDVACGTGYFTRLLVQHFPQVKGIDLNEAMITEAKEHSKNILDNLVFQQGNMLNLQAEQGKYDLVTCYADSLCFLANEEELKQALFSMANCLKPGGRLLFDVWTPYQLSQGFDQFSYHDEDENGALLWTSFTDPDELKVTHELTVYNYSHFEGRQALYTRHEVDLEERTYPLTTYIKYLNEAGFLSQQIQVRVQFGERLYHEFQDQQADRWFFVCQKGE
ncbi:Methyltransferase domain-containing protein [Facklamia miroungae]|uniref:Methyltransferase domain-containing protein n=2 Tax=Facklamia miroungae TaxID=120956 RepID=A0A1G7UIE5_9LACT|nr:class I SAM-dependent methyltransferase [Facklamia miroungae]SDG47257.1 Methyltransferase domain-containing protein [Facklamia miroungae]